MPTKWYEENIRKFQPRATRPPPNNNIIISDSTDDDIKEYECPNCNKILRRRQPTDDGYITCNFCYNEFVVEDARKKSKLSVPRGRNTEVFAATTPDPNTQYMKKKEPQLKDGALALSKKGIRFTSYYDSSAGREGAD